MLWAGLGAGGACLQTSSQGLGWAVFACDRRGSGVGWKALPTLAQGLPLSLARPWPLLPKNRPDDPRPAPRGRDRPEMCWGMGLAGRAPGPLWLLLGRFGSSRSLPALSSGPAPGFSGQLQASSRLLWASSRQLWAALGLCRKAGFPAALPLPWPNADPQLGPPQPSLVWG